MTIDLVLIVLGSELAKKQSLVLAPALLMHAVELYDILYPHLRL